jgi:CO dehydrogenase/acetyl-CoA synthase delta subunit
MALLLLTGNHFGMRFDDVVLTLQVSGDAATGARELWNMNEEKWSPAEWKLEITDRRQNCVVVTLVLPR